MFGTSRMRNVLFSCKSLYAMQSYLVLASRATVFITLMKLRWLTTHFRQLSSTNKSTLTFVFVAGSEKLGVDAHGYQKPSVD